MKNLENTCNNGKQKLFMLPAVFFMRLQKQKRKEARGETKDICTGLPPLKWPQNKKMQLTALTV